MNKTIKGSALYPQVRKERKIVQKQCVECGSTFKTHWAITKYCKTCKGIVNNRKARVSYFKSKKGQIKCTFCGRWGIPKGEKFLKCTWCKKSKEDKKECWFCSRLFKPKTWNQNYCNDICRDEAEKQRRHTKHLQKKYKIEIPNRRPEPPCEHPLHRLLPDCCPCKNTKLFYVAGRNYSESTNCCFCTLIKVLKELEQL